MKYVLFIIVGLYFGFLLAKAEIRPNTGLFWQFMLAQTLLIIAGASCVG